MKHFKQYDEIGKDYIKSQEQFFQNNDWSRKLVLDRIGEIADKVMVDAGCGHGVETRLILQGRPAKIIAFDPSEFMLEEARKRTTSPVVEFVQGDFTHIPAKDTSVDTLVACFSLHYMGNIDTAYQEVHRVLKVGGRAVFVTPHPEDSNSRKPDLNENELINITLYDDVTVSYPAHTMKEYFSPYVVENFDTADFEEVILPEVSKERPSVLAFTLIKK